MRYVLLGGSGFIGSALALALLQKGHQVVIVSRSPAKVPARAGMEVVGWDGHSAEGWGGVVDGADGVINLAGASIGSGLWTRARKAVLVQSRVDAGAAIVAAVRQAQKQPEVVFQISASGYYGISNERTFTEDDPSGSNFLARVAAQWEDATQPVEALGVRRVVARSGIVLSREAGALPRMMLPFRLFIGGPLGSGKQYISWVHPQDHIQAILFLLENPTCSGAYNLASPDARTNASFGRTLARAMRRPYWIPAPGFLLRLVLGQMSMVVLDGQRIYPKRLLDAGFAFRYAHLEDCVRDVLSVGVEGRAE